LLIVGSDINAPGSQVLKEAASRLGAEADIVLVTAPETRQLIQDAAHVIYRLRPKSHELFLKLNDDISGPHAALLDAMLAAFDKHKTYETLISNNIPTPHSSLVDSKVAIESYPVVAKILNGNQGIGVALLQSESDFETLKSVFPGEQEFLLQEFIEESSGTDMRLFIVSCFRSLHKRHACKK
jgi:hypothetical protein